MKGSCKMTNERLQKGMEKIKEYVSVEEANQMLTADALKELAPDLRRFIIEFAYGEIYSRPGLDSKQRQLVTISSLVTQGAEPQIETHIKRGLVVGLSHTEIIECIMQLVPYTGFPRVQNALMIAKKVFAEQ